MSERSETKELYRELDARSENLITRIQNLRAKSDRLERECEALRRDKEMPSILFDGPSVYAALTDRELGRTSPENVSDVLDAIVRCIRKERAETKG
jgi:hypothetical protein